MIRFSLLLASVACAPVAAFAAEVDIGGSVETSLFVGLQEGELFDYGNLNVLGVNLGADVNEHVAATSRVELRTMAGSNVSSSSDLGDRAALESLVLRIDESYVDYYGFVLDDLDVRVGKQRVIWGTADGFNPTSYLAPYDLQNPLDFTKKLGVTALLATYYAPWGIDLTGVVVPVFTPSLLPTDIFATSLPVDLDVLSGGMEVALGGVTDTVEMPALAVENVQAAARLGWTVFNVDMSASWFRGRSTLPVVAGIDATSFDLTEDPIPVDIDARLVYPELQAAGLDMATSLGGIGVWGEAAVFFPERIRSPLTVLGNDVNPLTGEDIDPILVVDDTPYVKAVAGLDYTFQGGYYFNLQYLRGFFHEQTAAALQDYALGVFRKKLFQDVVEIQLMGGGEIDDVEHIGWLAGGELIYAPFDASKLTLGGIVARGDDGTAFDMFSDLDQVYLRFRSDF